MFGRRSALGVFAAGLLRCAAPPGESREPVVATPATLAVRSAAAYRDNRSGVVTQETIEAWFADWAAHRPAGIEGELVAQAVVNKNATTTRKALDEDREYKRQ